MGEEQALYFRARRSHLAGPGAPDCSQAALAILGAQAQQLAPALHALSLRTAGRPAAAALKAALLEQAPRRLVRTWGQRDTLHLYDALSDWPLVVAARADWSQSGRRGAMPPDGLVDEAGARLEAAPGGAATRADLFDLLPSSYLQEAEAKIIQGGMAGKLDPHQFAAGRLLWSLALRGDACLGGKLGSEQVYVARGSWFPALAWKLPSATAANLALARRYLGAHAPATAADLAHFLGAKVTQARAWLDALRKQGELIGVDCADRSGLVALSADAGELIRDPPPSAADWPLRLLPMWDTLLMAHADKSWTLPDAGERKQVWRSSAVVKPVAIARGRVVAVWGQSVERGQLVVTVAPLGGWRKSMAAAVKREAESLAAHLELPCGAVVVESGLV